jgi:hypothetical protein
MRRAIVIAVCGSQVFCLDKNRITKSFIMFNEITLGRGPDADKGSHAAERGVLHNPKRELSGRVTLLYFLPTIFWNRNGL